MAESLYTTYVEIVGDSSPLEKEWRRIKRSSIKHADDIGRSVASRLTSRLTGLIGVLYSLKRAWDFALDAKNLARDADEIRSKFDQVFISIKEGANEIADSFSKNFGLAGSTARDLLSQTGDLLTGFGFTEQQALDLSLQINELAQDLTSFTNFEGGAKDASLSLTKALLGETESAKKLGIVIRQGTKEFQQQVEALKNTKGYTELQAKALVILDQAYNQSFKAIGDYERTKDSLANTERRINEQIKEQKEILGVDLANAYKIGIKLAFQLATNTGKAGTNMSAFSGVIKATTTPLIVVITLLKILGDIVGTAGASVAVSFDRIYKAFEKLVKGDLAGHFEELGSIFGKNGIAQVIKGGSDIIVSDWESMTNAIGDLWKKAGAEIDANPLIDDGLTSNLNAQVTELDKVLTSLQLQLETAEMLNKSKFAILQTTKETLKDLLKSATTDEDRLKITMAINDVTKEIKRTMDDINKGTFNPLQGKSADQLFKELTEGTKKLNKEQAIQLQRERIDAMISAEEVSHELAIRNIDDEFSKREAEINREFDLLLEKYSEYNGERLGLEKQFAETRTQIEQARELELRRLQQERYRSALGAVRTIVNTMDFDPAGQSLIAHFSRILEIAEKVKAVIESINLLSSLVSVGGLFSGGTSAAGGASAALKAGGTFYKGQVTPYRGIPRFAGGASFIVPQGYPKDSYLMRVQEGEKVNVTPAYRAGDTDRLLAQIAKRLGVLSVVMQNLDLSVDITNNAPDTDTIVRRNKRRENILTRNGIKFDNR